MCLNLRNKESGISKFLIPISQTLNGSNRLCTFPVYEKLYEGKWEREQP